MAVINNQPGKEAGDKRVYEALRSLSDEWIIYAQPLLVHAEKRHEPDYILINKNWGAYIILEVKDWRIIEFIDNRKLRVRQVKTGQWRDEKSPLDQAIEAAHLLNDILTADKDIIDHAGNTFFSYTFGAVLPNLSSIMIHNCNELWGEKRILGQEDLKSDVLDKKLKSLPIHRRCIMTDKEVNAIRAAINGKNKLIDLSTGQFKGILDQDQETIAMEELVPVLVAPVVQPVRQDALFANLFPDPHARRELLEQEAPGEVRELKADMHVRLVRGFAGTGKTDVLILRAQYLAEHARGLKILVTTFNDPIYQKRLVPELAHLKKQVDVIKFDTLCASVFKKHNQAWKKPQSTTALLKAMSKVNKAIDEWGVDFLAEEFTWMKESGRTKKEDYISKPREGRRSTSGKTLSTGQKKELFEVFEKYELQLKSMPAFDWADMHNKTFEFLKAGTKVEKKYDVILIDEAQHFAPVWVKIINNFLEPGGVLFLCDDPSQSVFRFFSWKQKGLDVVGRTRWLRVPYRCTRQIFSAAFNLIANDENAKKLLSEDQNFAIPDLSNPNLRDGELPLVKIFESVDAEKKFIYEKIDELKKCGILAEEICILHTQPYVRNSFEKNRIPGVVIENTIRQTGMEYKAVFLPRVQDLFDRKVGTSWEDDQSIIRSNFYTCMTRARSHLYMTYQQKWPKAFEVIKPFVDWKDK